MAQMDEPVLTIQSLGSFQMTVGGQPITGMNQALSLIHIWW